MKFEAQSGDVVVEMTSPEVKSLIEQYLGDLIKGYQEDHPGLRVFVRGYEATTPWGLSNAVQALLDGQDPEEWPGIVRGVGYDISIAVDTVRDVLEAHLERLKRELDP